MLLVSIFERYVMAESPFLQGTCAYCGSVGDVTDDHVIPKCLWPGRVRKDAPIVDACRPCNHIWKSEYDTYLRDMLVNDKACAKNPIAQKVRERYYRSAANNRPGHPYPEVWILNFYRSIRFVVSIRADISKNNRIIVPTLVSNRYDYMPFFVSD